MPLVLPHLCSALELHVPVLHLPAVQGSRFGTKREESEGWSFLILNSLLLGTERVNEIGLLMGPHTQDMATLLPTFPQRIQPLL